MSDTDIAADGGLPNDAVHPGTDGAPDSLTLAGGLTALGARGDKIAAMVARLRRSYRFIAVDIGAFDDASCPFWRSHVDKLLLVVDVESTRREVLEHFRKELDRSVVRFDGFVANRRVHHIPRLLYRMIS
ncbi:MAG: CpsD/CapB family tyrosine-protein kinase [Alphaproteobacteria bacterium]|nr:CpsD/CapB family tyrosine-protein kinase [Alphaproteobacteria bacterium]